MVGLGLWLVFAGFAALAPVTAFADESSTLSHDVWIVAATLVVLAIAAVGAWITAHTLNSVVGWTILFLSGAFALAVVSGEYIAYSVSPGGETDRADEVIAVLGHLSFPAIVLGAGFFLLAGSPARRSLRLPLAAAGLAALASFALLPGPLPRFPAVENPLGVALGDAEVIAASAWLPVASMMLMYGVLALTKRAREESSARRDADVEEEPQEREPDDDGPLLGEPPKHAWAFLKDFPRVLPYVRPYWKLAVSSVALLGVGVLAGLLAPWPLAILVDTVLGDKPLPSLLGFLPDWDTTTLLIAAVVAGVVVTALAEGVGMAQSYVDTALEQRMVL